MVSRPEFCYHCSFLVGPISPGLIVFTRLTRFAVDRFALDLAPHTGTLLYSSLYTESGFVIYFCAPLSGKGFRHHKGFRRFAPHSA